MRYVIHNGKTVGLITVDNIYVTHRNKPDIHFWRKYQGFGISTDIIEKHPEIRLIVIVYHGDTIEYWKISREKLMMCEKVIDGDDEQYRVTKDVLDEHHVSK